MALIGYARVSTGDQKLSLQHDALNAAGCERIFDDHAFGAKTDRPRLTEALAYLRAGDTLVVWKLDRLGRSMSHLIEKVGELAARGVGFRSLTEQIDTTTSGGMLVFSIFGSLAQFEGDLIRERTNAGLKAARERGSLGGRRPVITTDQFEMVAHQIRLFCRTHLVDGRVYGSDHRFGLFDLDIMSAVGNLRVAAVG